MGHLYGASRNFFGANCIDKNNKNRAILLTSVGTYTLLRNLYAPKKPTEQS